MATNQLSNTTSISLHERNAMIRRDRMMGHTLSEIAKTWRLSKTHVWRIAYGVTALISPRKRIRKTRKRPERAERYLQLRAQAVELRKRGYSHRQIAERTGLGHAAAHTYTRNVPIFSLEGNAWLSRKQGRPRAWKRSLGQAKQGGVNAN